MFSYAIIPFLYLIVYKASIPPALLGVFNTMFLLSPSAWFYLTLSISVPLPCRSAATKAVPSVPATIGPPIPPPAYMVDITDNYFHAAPDRYLAKDEYPSITGRSSYNSSDFELLSSRAATASGSSYWLANMAHGKVRNTNELLGISKFESRTYY